MLVSIWAMIFLVIWKRKQFELTYKWNCSDYEESDELIRPKYVQKAAGKIKYIPGTVQNWEIVSYARTGRLREGLSFGSVKCSKEIIYVAAHAFTFLIRCVFPRK